MFTLLPPFPSRNLSLRLGLNFERHLKLRLTGCLPKQSWSLLYPYKLIRTGSDWRIRKFLQVRLTCTERHVSLKLLWAFQRLPRDTEIASIRATFYYEQRLTYLSSTFSVFEAELQDVIPICHATIAGTRIVGRLTAGYAIHVQLPPSLSRSPASHKDTPIY